MLLLLDIGNTHTHVGLAGARGIRRHADLRTAGWRSGAAAKELAAFVGSARVDGCCLCSVVPSVTARVERRVKQMGVPSVLRLTHQTLRGVGIRYPRPETIGPDRLSNALAVRVRHGAPAVVVDFGTAVTFDVVDAAGCYAGGVIAPGLSLMTDYLHEKTALLPRIEIRDVTSSIGKSTEEAMRIGAVHGYRGLVRELLTRLRAELGPGPIPVIATGGYARLISKGLPEIDAVEPLLTLEGLRTLWELSNP